MRIALRSLLAPSLVALSATSAYAAGPDLGPIAKTAVNPTAIVIFLLFVLLTLGITYRAARTTKSASSATLAAA